MGQHRRDGAVVKRSATAPEMYLHEGPARVFDAEDDAIKAIYGGEIHPGDVIVIRYEGPKGGPGMREMLNPTSALAGMKLDSTVALITDGRFSGAKPWRVDRSCLPRSRCGGEIALIERGDRIAIDINPRNSQSAHLGRGDGGAAQDMETPSSPRFKPGGSPLCAPGHLGQPGGRARIAFARTKPTKREGR